MRFLHTAEMNIVSGISVSTQGAGGWMVLVAAGEEGRAQVCACGRNPDGCLGAVMPAASHGRCPVPAPSQPHTQGGFQPQTLCFPFPLPSRKEAGAASPVIPAGCLATGMLSDQDPPAHFPPCQK